jgi:hypothetical protein
MASRRAGGLVGDRRCNHPAAESTAVSIGWRDNSPGRWQR